MHWMVRSRRPAASRCSVRQRCGLVQVVHGLPPPAGIAALHLGTHVADQRVVEICLRAVAFVAIAVALPNDLDERDARDHGDRDQRRGDGRRQPGIAPAPEGHAAKRANAASLNRLALLKSRQVVGQFHGAVRSAATEICSGT